MDFERHVYAIQRYVRLTQPKYSQLFKADVPVQPICCFGDVETAEVITVGVNPSVREFEGRGWPASMNHIELAKRCKNYFTSESSVASHPYFEPWKVSLKSIGNDYKTGAAHIDISPRATRFIRDLSAGLEIELFLEMVERDLWIFFATLELCRHAKLLLIAGSVTSRYYLNEFLQRFSPDYHCALVGDFDRRRHPGQGKTCWHELDMPRGKVPVFFCSSGPAAGDPNLLPTRVHENKTLIEKKLRA